MSIQHPMLSIVIPVYNEQDVLPECYQRLTNVCRTLGFEYELVFVDDGSTDESLQQLIMMRVSDPAVNIISFSRNFGHQIAITAGLDHARGEIAAVIDADLQDPPELIAEFVAQWQKGYQVVYGRRRTRTHDRWFKRITAHGFYRLLTMVTREHIPEQVGDFRLMDRVVVNALRAMPERHRFIRGLVSWAGFRQMPIDYDRARRNRGSTKYFFRTMIRFALDGVTSFSIVPLQLATSLGFLITVITVVAAIVVLLLKFVFHHTIQGWTSLMLTILFIGGVQLFVVGVLGEYIGRIYEEVKKRPLYIVQSKLGFEDKE